MENQLLVNTDLQVSSICFGTAHIGSVLDTPTSFQLMDQYADYGGNFIDTANIYAAWISGGKGISEQTIGAWMKARRNRHHIVLATKGAHPHLDRMHIPRMSVSAITEDLDQSLHDVGTDYIDIYYLHRDHVLTPVEEILDALESKVKEGKIRYYACSNWHHSRIREAAQIAQVRGYRGFVANQMMWSLADVNPEALTDPTLVNMDEHTLSYHRECGLTAIPYTAQANGFFTKLHQYGVAGLSPQLVARYVNEVNLARYKIILEYCSDWGISVTTVVLAYIRSQPGFQAIPIIGASSLDQLRDSLAQHEVRLDRQQVERLESVNT